MKTLYLLRHTEAMPGQPDIERILTEKGADDAKALGVHMKEKNYVPEMAACSAALRTRQTLEGVMQSVKIGAVRHEKTIYHAHTEELLDFIRGLDDTHASALIVGHNPVIHELAAGLASDDAPDFIAELARGYKPGTLAVFHILHASWRDVQLAENRLADLLLPG